ncbi:MAG: hypothetical protein UZ22_OP11002000901 [Microgenomates bacterium OLB23]|nr:MAG: hypothetical protein UZ22_OP11002000901 [Microgenomates bacterium OLB23]
MFKIKESGAQEWYATSTYKPNEIGDSTMHPFGFPLIEQAKNKEYDILLTVTNKQSKENIILNIDDGVAIRTVNQISKKELITNPRMLVQLLLLRMQNVARNTEAQQVAMQLLPFIAFLVFLNTRKMQTG